MGIYPIRRFILEPRSLKCRDCGVDFEFDAGQADYFNSRGLENYPARCPQCSADNKARQNAERVMTPIICCQCGAEDFVPFQPRDHASVLCHTCYQAQKER